MGRKRHIITDTLGLMLFVTIHAASIQDRNGAVDRIKAIRYRFPGLRHLFAGAGHAGDKLIGALQGHGQWRLEIVRRCDAAKGFVLLPHRWVVERTFAWLGRCQRHAKDWERTIESFTASTTIAHIHHPTRLITSHCQIT
jgi:putative transposase